MISISETKDHRLLAELNADVQNLHAQLHPEIFKPYNRDEMIRAMENFTSDPHCRIYVAALQDQPIGSMVCMIKEAKENAFHYTIRSIHIDQISVLKEHRRSGAGKLLMEQAEKLARQLSITRLELDHWNANTVAASYFRKNGYELRKERLVKLIRL